MILNKLVWLIGGEAGYGIMASGAMFSKACSRAGLQAFDYAEYPSLIRGGHNAFYVRVDAEEIFSMNSTVNLLVALNKETVDRHIHELSADGAIIYDDLNMDFAGKKAYQVPLLQLTKQSGGDLIMRNTVAVGASFGLLHLDFEYLRDVIDDVFKGKSKDIISLNENAAKLGYDYVKEHYTNFPYGINPMKSEPRILVTGNDALSLGALKAGMKFLAAYPMTPINSIIAYLASKEHEFSIIVKQPEDEIAAINMTIGASLAGVRSMTCTSGGGFCLMVEGLGLAGMTETPIVVIMGQRPGPATGLPTWTEQSDLKFIINAAQGEFPRIVLAPGDVDECFGLIQQAFYLAEKYQLPVIVFTDKLLSESHKTTRPFDSSGRVERQSMAQDLPGYRRYAFTESGISPRAIPSNQNTIFMATSDEHDQAGVFNEEPENRKAMMDKRFLKLEMAAKEMPKQESYGSKDAELTVISWGSTKGAVLEAFKLLDIKVNMLHLTQLWPFPKDIVTETIKNAQETMVIEGNKTGQLTSLIREQTGLAVDHEFLKYTGRPFYPEEIRDAILEAVR